MKFVIFERGKPKQVVAVICMIESWKQFRDRWFSDFDPQQHDFREIHDDKPVVKQERIGDATVVIYKVMTDRLLQEIAIASKIPSIKLIRDSLLEGESLNVGPYRYRLAN